MSDDRSNRYWRKRLIQDSHDKLVAQVDAGDITYYRATVQAGYRKKKKQGLALVEREWVKLSRRDREKFVAKNLREVNEIVRRVGQYLIDQKKAKKAK